MKRFFYLTGIIFVSGIIFFNLGLFQKISAISTPGLTGSITSSAASVPVGTQFTITMTGTTNVEDKAMEYLQLSSTQLGVYLFYNCVLGTEGNSPVNMTGEVWKNGTLEKTCTHTFNLAFNTSDRPLNTGSYAFDGAVYDFKAVPVGGIYYGSHVGGLYGQTDIQPITVSVTSAPAAPGTPNEICDRDFTIMDKTCKGGHNCSASDWCGNLGGSCETQNWAGCVGNDWVYFGCEKSGLACSCKSDSSVTGESKNDDKCLVTDAVGTPTIITPKNFAEVPLTGQLSWEAAPDTSAYRIAQYKWAIYNAVEDLDTGGFAQGEEVDSSTISAVQTSVNLSSRIQTGRYYLWSVKAFTNTGRESDWSRPFGSLRTIGATLPGPGPITGVPGQPPAPPPSAAVGRECPSPMSIKNPNIYCAETNANGQCLPGKYVAYDGLVPCGKCSAINVALDAKGKPTLNAQGYLLSSANKFIDCQFCHFFVMFKGIVDWVIGILVPVIAVLMLVIGGIMFFFGGTNPSLLLTAKKMITSVIWGLVIIFAAYAIVNTILAAIGLADVSVTGFDLRKWFQFPCKIKIP